MGGTVSVTTETETTAQQLQNEIANTRSKIDQLLSRGNTLANESDWTGPDAAKWRNHWESHVQSTLTSIGNQLEQIAEECRQIAGDIFRAGGRG